jgi:hypothetical protein
MISRADFRSMADLGRLLAHQLWRVPADVALVAAVPDSGRVPAAFLGLQIGRPVVDLDDLLDDLLGGAPAGAPPGGPERGRVLLVDDTCLTGRTMAAARARLAAARPGLAVTSLAAYVRPEAAGAVELALETVPGPVVCEWSLFRAWTGKACFDLDGILCGDCPAEDDDDGPRYRRFLETAPPLVVPRGRLRRIVTARLERYRPETEAWLERHGIAWDALDMLDLPSEAERRRLRPQARFKAAAFLADAEAALFVESESWQAREIAALAGGRPVFDYQARRALDAGLVAGHGLQRRVRRRLLGLGRDVSRRLLGRPA